MSYLGIFNFFLPLMKIRAFNRSINPFPIGVTLVSCLFFWKIALPSQLMFVASLVIFLTISDPPHFTMCSLVAASSVSHGCIYPWLGEVTQVLFPGGQQEDGGRQCLPDSSFLSPPCGEQERHPES